MANPKIPAGRPLPPEFGEESPYLTGELLNKSVFHLFAIVGGYAEHRPLCGAGGEVWHHSPSGEFDVTVCAKCLRAARA